MQHYLRSGTQRYDGEDRGGMSGPRDGGDEPVSFFRLAWVGFRSRRFDIHESGEVATRAVFASPITV